MRRKAFLLALDFQRVKSETTGNTIHFSMPRRVNSTDYQPATALRALVDDGFGILKVGPGITFALREALYGLDDIVDALGGPPGSRH